MSKMGLHEPFGHLQHKLWQKERPGVKLPIWLPTTRSQELTWPQCVQGECDTLLESSWRKLQVCLKSHPNQSSEKIIITLQSGGSPNQDSFLLVSPEIKSHSNVGATERCKEYYMGEGGGFPRVQAVVSLVSPKLPMACPSIKGLS
jgi:hypothetical protein